MTDSERPRLLVVSRVLPVPGYAGQQERVRNKLLGFRRRFHVTFLTVAPRDSVDSVERHLRPFCDESVVFPSRYGAWPASRIIYRLAAGAYGLATSLKPSNFITQHVELRRRRVESFLQGERFDGAVFEYWHTRHLARLCRDLSIPTVLDMHNLLWKSYDQQLARRRIPSPIRRARVQRYRQIEESSWDEFDALITINREEHRYTRERTGADKKLFYAPMGIDLSRWSYDYSPAKPQRVGYFGGLGSPHNQQAVIEGFERVMPRIWHRLPETEYWIIGANPPPKLRELADTDPRVRVTGFVEDIQSVLRQLSVSICPWKGRYGFRSRLVQLLALGVPVVTTPDAIAGMDLSEGRGVSVAELPDRMAQLAIELLESPQLARRVSSEGRAAVEALYSFEATYGRLTDGLHGWLRSDSSGKYVAGSIS